MSFLCSCAGTDVAVKYADARVAPQLVQHLRHEAEVLQILAGLPEAHVAPLALAGTTGSTHDKFMLCTKLVPNARHLQPDLDHHLLPAALAALASVHSRRVMHGDLRRSNILVGGTADQQNVVLIDFGLAVASATPAQLQAEVQQMTQLFTA